MRTCKPSDMEDRNIRTRRNVFHSKQRRLVITSNIDMKELMREWPPDLKKEYYLCGGLNVINPENRKQIYTIVLNLRKIESLNRYMGFIDSFLELIGNELWYTPEGYNSECSNPSFSSNEDSNESSETNLPVIGKWSIEKIIIVICCFVIIVPVLLWLYTTEEVSVFSDSSKIEEWEKNILDLGNKFPSQDANIWYSIQSGVKTTFVEKPTQPSVFLLLHNDEKSSTCIAQAIGKEAAKLLNDYPQEPIIVKGEELKMNNSLISDYGLFTEIYKQEIEKKHVMIIFNLQDIPAVLAQTFHVLCDVENPLVRDAVFLFTMQIDGIEKQKPTAIAEKHLNLLWRNSLKVDIMDPLITRVTNMVLSLKFENNISC